MVLGFETKDNLPDFDRIEAFLFSGSGIVMHKGVWYDFPYALEGDTQVAVILRHEAHLNTLENIEHEFEAEGPDLRRRVGARADIEVDF